MIDETDHRILTLLQDDARLPNAEIARRLGMAASAIHERIKKLEARGLIQAYEARLDPGPLGRKLLAFVFVRSDELPGEALTGDRLAAIPEVLEVHHVAGEDCYLAKVRCSDTEELGRLLRQRFSHCAPHQPRRRRGVHLESQGAPPPSRDHLRATRDIVLERRGRPTAHPLQRQPVRVPDDVQRCASCDRARSDGPHTRRSQRSRPCVDLCGVDPTERLPCSLAHLRAELELTELEELAVRIEVSFAFAATASRAARYDGSALSPSVCCCRPRI